MKKKKILRIFIITFFLIICFFVALYIVGISGEPYEYALNFLENNKILIDHVGVIKNIRLAIFGYSVKYSGPHGYAEYKILVEGQKSNGSVYINLERSAGIWKVTHATLSLANGKKHPLY